MKRVGHNFVLLLAALLVLSCGKASQEATFANQETRITSYIDSEVKAGGSFVDNGGIYRVIKKDEEGTGEALQASGVVSFYYAAYIFTGSKSYSNMIATNRKQSAQDAGWDTSDETRFEALTVGLEESGFVEGLKRGLVGVKADQHADIVFSGRYGFGNKIYGMVPANAAFLYEIWVVAVTN